MSEGNAEIVRSMYSRFGELAAGADVDAYVAAYYDEGCEYHPVEEANVIRGHAALVQWNRRWFDAWNVFRAEVEDIREVDGVILACVKVSGRGGESGMEVGQRIFHVLELLNGRILRMREFVDRDAALKAAGLAAG